MSNTILQTRTTPDSPLETTHSKKRAIDPREQKSIDALFKGLPFQRRTIATLIEHLSVEKLAHFLEKTPKLLQKAEEMLAGIPESEEGVEKFSNVVRGIWPLLVTGIRKAMDSREDVIGLVVRCANRDSATLRWARMKADPALESSLANIKPPTSEFDILRLFLSILIGYWGDKAELPKLDAAINRHCAFGFWVSVSEPKKGNPPPEKLEKLLENHVKVLSYQIKDDEDVKDAERVREWLESEYAHYENVDVDALFDKIKTKMLSQVEGGLFCGRKAIVDIRVANPWVVVRVR